MLQPLHNGEGVEQPPVQNLWYMRQFYLEYSASELLQPLVGEISWAKHLLIIARCKDPLQRYFYTVQTQHQAWTKTVLAQHNFATTLATLHLEQAAMALKDEYTFGFLELAGEHSEYERARFIGWTASSELLSVVFPSCYRATSLTCWHIGEKFRQTYLVNIQQPQQAF